MRRDHMAKPIKNGGKQLLADKVKKKKIPDEGFLDTFFSPDLRLREIEKIFLPMTIFFLVLLFSFPTNII